MGDLGVLGKIAEKRAASVAEAKKKTPVSALRASALYKRTPLSLSESLCVEPGPRVIAEVKFVSPSEGVLRPGASPKAAAEIAHAYARAGAAAISILTEPEYFGGSPAFLEAARKECPDTPLLMKDFFVDEWQLEQARSVGADAILLIAALLKERLAPMYSAAKDLGLSVLTEVHDEAELEAALKVGAGCIGVNSRDLKTLKVDVAVARRLAPLAIRSKAAVAESGLRSRAEIDSLAALGYKGFLVGTSFMKSPYPAVALKTFLS